MAYVLANTGTKVKRYKFSNRPGLGKGDFELVDILDLIEVPGFATKPAAEAAAVALGLNTWRYVQI